MEEKDISYVFGGYSPIIIKLIEKAVTIGWRKITNSLDDLPGETYFPEMKVILLILKVKILFY